MSRRAKRNPSNDRRSPAHNAPLTSPGGSLSRPAAQLHPRWLTAAACLCLALAVWCVYGQTLHHDFVNFDDNVYVYDNPMIARGLSWDGVVWAFTTVQVGTWQPLVWLSFMIESALHGPTAGWFHLTNVLLHMANTLLLLFVLRRMGGGLWRSLFVAALFALHPLHVESVAWVTERKDVLSALFWMLTMWGYLRYAERPGAARYLAAVVLFALGLMAKPMLMTLPAVLLLVDWWPLGRISIGRASGDTEKPEVEKALTGACGIHACPAASPVRILLEKLPFLALAIASCAVTAVAQQKCGAIAALQDVSLGNRMASVLIAYVLYLWKMLWPACLYAPYVRSAIQPWWQITGACVVLAGLTFAAVKTARQRSYVLFGWLWYLGTLIPVIGFVQIGVQFMADRFTYIPLVGIFIIITWGAAQLCGAWRYRRAVLGSAAGAILAGLLAAAYVQTGYWKNSITLWTHTLACTSENYFAHNNLGFALAEQGKAPDAIKHYERAIQLNPYYAATYNNLGLALAGQGKLPEAIKLYERAIELNPGYAEAHNNAGIALYWQGKLPEAIEHYGRAIQLNPDSPKTHCNVAGALIMQGKPAEALPHLQQALKLATAQNNTEIAEFIRSKLKSFPPAVPQPQAR